MTAPAAAVPQPGDPLARPGNHPKENTVTYTHADVELVARALHDHPGDTPFDYYDDAKRALDALAAAGRLRTATQHVESSVEELPAGHLDAGQKHKSGCTSWGRPRTPGS